MSRPRTVYLDSLGCEKNTVDSESALGLLLARGYRLVAKPEDADLIVVNTCGFLASAREESVERLRELGLRKRGGRLVAMGCLIQGRTHDVQALVPQVDAVLGVGQYDKLADIDLGETPAALPPDLAPYLGYSTRALLGQRHFAHLKIAEGCNQSCAFCKIPLLRGTQRSRPIAEIVAEAESLARQGAGELILIAQNSSAYGIDLPGQPRLPELCRELAQIDGVRWLRVMYAYPAMFTDRMAAELYGIDAVVSYLDIPIQHASPTVLERMRRGYDPVRLRRQVERLRRLRPDIMLRSTALVGFPGETEEDLVCLLDFLAEMQFDHLATFTYSHEAGTSAASLTDDLEAAEKEDRRARVESLQWDLGAARRARWLGRRLEVVVDELIEPHDREAVAAAACEDGVDPRPGWTGRPVALARSGGFAPQIDGGVWLDGAGLAVGDRLQVRCVGSGPFDLFAQVEGI
jgi:ribosomal protein S12 methylthiotransferase